jgi:hypothetical protein
MRAIAHSILCTAFAGGIGLIVEAVMQHLEPDLHFIAVRCYGTFAFCITILVCMLVMRAQARPAEF